MKKIYSMLGVEKEFALSNIWAHYEKRLKEKNNFYSPEVKNIKMDFTYIAEHDYRVAFWLIRKESHLVVQCYAFCYSYSTSWQLILTKEFGLPKFEHGFDAVKTEVELKKIFNEFLEMKCKDDKKDDMLEVNINENVKAVEFFKDLPKEEDNIQKGEVWKVERTNTSDYTFKGYYAWSGEGWEFAGDLD